MILRTPREEQTYGPHGLPIKQTALSEMPVPLGRTEPIQIGAVRWHKREAAAPLTLE